MTEAEIRQRQQLARANRERMAGNRSAPDTLRRYKAGSRPKAHKGELGLTVDADGRALIARDGRGGVPPSIWEMMLIAENEKLRRENDMLKKALAKTGSAA